MLPHDRGKVSRRELLQLVEASVDDEGSGAAGLGAALQGLLEEPQALIQLEVIEMHLDGKPAQRGGVDSLHQVGRAHEDSVELFHAAEHFIDLRDFPLILQATAIIQKAVGFVQDQDRALLPRLGEHLGDVLLGFAHVLGEQVGGVLDQQGAVDLVRDVVGERRLAGAGGAVEAERAFRLTPQAGNQRCKVEAGIEIVEAVARGHASAHGGGAGAFHGTDRLGRVGEDAVGDLFCGAGSPAGAIK